MLEISLLGHPQVFSNGEAIHLVRRKSRALLYYVAASRRSVQRDKLVSIFWPDLPRPTGLQTLRTTIYGLRSQLSPWLVSTEDAIELDGEVRVDVWAVDELLSPADIELEQLTRAVAAYRGDFLEDFSLPDAGAFEDWVTYQRAYYQRLLVRALTRLSQLYESVGDFQQALESLERGLRFNPLQEDLQRESIRLHYLAGDRPGAIRKYDELRKLLDEEMGVPPMVETRALYDAILNDRLATGPASPARAKPAFQPGTTAARRYVKEQDSTSAGGQLPFIGRSKQMAIMQQSLSAQRLVMIEGQPGIGKTRLTEEYIKRVPGIVLVGRARELEQGLPYQPFIEALRSLAVRSDWVHLQMDLERRVAPVWLAEVNLLAPGLFNNVPHPSGQLKAADESRLWEGVAQFLYALTNLQPVTLFLDDLHWADASTIGLLGYLVRQTADRPIGYIVANRPVTPRSALVSLMQSLGRENMITRLSLERLEAAEITAMAEGISHAHAQPLADWLWRSSEGNPFVLTELVQFAREQGWLDQKGETDLQALSSGLTVPHNVYELITVRLGRLSDSARRMLDAAVAAGREFEFEVVLHAAGLSEVAGLDALDELHAAGLVSELRGRTFTIDHPLTMEVAYREVGELRHRLLHRRVAEAMETIHHDRLKEIAGLLAWHFTEGKDLQRAAPYAVWAAARAAELAAWNEAIVFYKQALQGVTAQEKLPVTVLLGEAYLKFGKFSLASETLHEALLMAEERADGSLMNSIRLILGSSLLPQARYAEAIELAKEVSKSDRPELVIQAELLLGTALSIEGADLESARQHMLDAQARWEQASQPDYAQLAQIQFELGSVLAQQGDLAQAIQYYQQALDSANQLQFDAALDRRILAYNNLAYHMLLAGDERASQYAKTGLELAIEKGVVGLQTYLYSTMGEIALAHDALDEAESHFNTGLKLAEQFAVPERVAGLQANLGLVAIRRGQTSLAIHLLSSGLSEADGLGTQHLATQIRIWLAPLLPPQEARRILAEAHASAEASGRQRLLEQVLSVEKEIGTN